MASKTDKIIKQFKTKPEQRTPIASAGDEGIFIPNHSGISTHPEAVSNFVPYTGANANVDLGAFNITTTGTITSDDITIINGNLLLDSSGTANNRVDRGAVTNFASYVMATAGTDQWTIGLRNDSTNDFHFRDSVNSRTPLKITQSSGDVTFSNDVTIGAGAAATDYTLTFDGETNDGVLTWMEDEDYFQFSDDILMATTEKAYFRDTGLYIYSSTDGQLDIIADTLLQLGATGNLELNNGVNIALGSGTGTKIGTATTQLLGFYNKTPVDQPSAYTQTFGAVDKTHALSTFAAVSETAATQTTPFGYSTAAQANAIPVELNDLADDVDDLKRLVNAVIDDLQEMGLVG